MNEYMLVDYTSKSLSQFKMTCTMLFSLCDNFKKQACNDPILFQENIIYFGNIWNNLVNQLQDEDRHLSGICMGECLEYALDNELFKKLVEYAKLVSINVT